MGQKLRYVESIGRFEGRTHHAWWLIDKSVNQCVLIGAPNAAFTLHDMASFRLHLLARGALCGG